MHVITVGRLREAWKKYPDATASLQVWHKLVESCDFNSFAELKTSIPFAPDHVGNFVVFNIGGNKYRLIVYIDYTNKKVFIRHFLTHAEYSKDTWKNDEWYQK